MTHLQVKVLHHELMKMLKEVPVREVNEPFQNVMLHVRTLDELKYEKPQTRQINNLQLTFSAV